MTRAVPASCRSIARLTSTSRQYRDARKSALTKQQDNAGLLEVLIDGPVPLGARLDTAVVPAADDPLVLQQAEMRLEPVPKRFVPLRIREEQRDRVAGSSEEDGEAAIGRTSGLGPLIVGPGPCTT